LKQFFTAAVRIIPVDEFVLSVALAPGIQNYATAFSVTSIGRTNSNSAPLLPSDDAVS
jgi:hypothetical protein